MTANLLTVDLRAAAERIRLRIERSATDVVAIGLDLLKVKSSLEHGRFLEWIETEFDMSEASALRFMQVAERFKSVTVTDFTPSVLYALAAPSTPDEVVQEVTQRAAKGEKITAAEVKRLKARAAQADEFEAKTASLTETTRQLQRQLSDLTGQLESAREPQFITSRVDMEPLWEALVALWRRLPMELRERFFAEVLTPYSVPLSQRNGHTDDPVAETIDGDGPMYEDTGEHRGEILAQPAAASLENGSPDKAGRERPAGAARENGSAATVAPSISEQGGANDLAVAQHDNTDPGRETGEEQSEPAPAKQTDPGGAADDLVANGGGRESHASANAGGRSAGERKAEGDRSGQGVSRQAASTPAAPAEEDPFYELTFHRRSPPTLPPVSEFDGKRDLPAHLRRAGLDWST